MAHARSLHIEAGEVVTCVLRLVVNGGSVVKRGSIVVYVSHVSPVKAGPIIGRSVASTAHPCPRRCGRGRDVLGVHNHRACMDAPDLRAPNSNVDKCRTGWGQARAHSPIAVSLASFVLLAGAVQLAACTPALVAPVGMATLTRHHCLLRSVDNVANAALSRPGPRLVATRCCRPRGSFRLPGAAIRHIPVAVPASHRSGHIHS